MEGKKQKGTDRGEETEKWKGKGRWVRQRK
jgi:hypothetical protein